jgi:hypothetical protein
VPQASLAPELRRAGEAAATDPDAPVVAQPGAAGALSRYQASRRSAQAIIDSDGSGS